MTPKIPPLAPNRLLAKSVQGRWRGSYSLVGHTADVVRAVTILVDRLNDRLLAQFDLGCDLIQLRQTVRLAAYLHDWGKANDHFQGVVRKDMDNATPKRNPMQQPQLLRHEILSVLLAWEFRDWLQQAPGDFLTALAVAGGHHLKLGGKAGNLTDEVGEIREGCGDECIALYLTHPDFKRVLRFGIQQLQCPRGPITLASGKIPSQFSVQKLKQHREEIRNEAFVEWQPHPVLVALLKALLVAGDSLGSAIATSDLKLDRWVREALDCTLTEADLDGVIQARLQGNSPRAFQRDLGNITGRVGLAQAGCGTGKTVGAYYWAKRHAVGRKLFFCYPTTGTSTEGFLDYVQEEVKSVLLHSRAAVDLALARTGEEAAAGENGINEAAIKLQSFEAWECPAIVCTVDTVLGLLQCHRRPLYSFPAIANAAFVFDEVHCYDKALFGALLRFLETVKAPVLLMSASFLPAQLQAIQQAVGEPLTIVPGPKELELQPCYRFHYAAAPDWQRVEAELANRGKVLWVCNQVSTAVQVYEEAQQRELKPFLYHSRFRYRDRVQHHREVVDAFQRDRTDPVLAIATQVAEMSLDLSATLLLSQIAEPAALIQRLGRLNRRYCGRPLDALFYWDAKDKPYAQEVRDRGKAMVMNFSGDVCQADLAQWLEQQASSFKPERYSVLLDGAWRTYPASLRQGGVTVTALMEADRPQFEQMPSQLNLYTVPLLADDKQVCQWERFKGYPVAPSSEWGYCSDKGAYRL